MVTAKGHVGKPLLHRIKPKTDADSPRPRLHPSRARPAWSDEYATSLSLSAGGRPARLLARAASSATTTASLVVPWRGWVEPGGARWVRDHLRRGRYKRLQVCNEPRSTAPGK